MNIALCYDQVNPARGGCSTYIIDLTRRLLRDGHDVHLYAVQWDGKALPSEVRCHVIAAPRGPRFMRPWVFGKACLKACEEGGHQVSVGFDKTWGQDVLYPQGGLHAASAAYNLDKYQSLVMRAMASLVKKMDPAHQSFQLLERKQYFGLKQPIVIVNSRMVLRHFQQFYGVTPDDVRVVHSAIDPGRFVSHDRLRVRHDWRLRLQVGPEDVVGLFVAMNYRLKGIVPLLHAARGLRSERFLKIVIAGNAETRKYERLASQLGVGDRVRFVGHCKEIKSLYFAGDFLVHPTFYDPCSLVVMEALACGLPVITTRSNGASELLHPPGDGYVIDDPHDHDRLAWAMSQMVDNGRRAASSQAARQAALQWTFDDHYGELVKIFSEAAARRAAA